MCIKSTNFWSGKAISDFFYSLFITTLFFFVLYILLSITCFFLKNI